MQADMTLSEEVRDHRRTFVAFEKLVIFGTMHVALVLACLALAFVGHASSIALLIGLGGTLALIIGAAVTGRQAVP